MVKQQTFELIWNNQDDGKDNQSIKEDVMIKRNQKKLNSRNKESIDVISKNTENLQFNSNSPKISFNLKMRTETVISFLNSKTGGCKKLRN